MHANLPKIANRWEQKYGLGGIAEQNAQLNQLPEYYLPVAQGGRIGYSQGSGSDYLQYVQAMNALNLQPMPLEIFNSLRPIMSLQDMVNMGSPGKAEGGRIGFAEGPKTYEAWLDYRIKEIAKGNLPVPFERWKKGDIKMNQGGMVPAHQTGILGLAEGGKIIDGQAHQLSYITPGEAKTLQDLGGRKVMTPEGIPAYPPQDNYSGPSYDGGNQNTGGNQGSDHGHSRFDVGSGYYGETKTTTPSTPDDSGDDDKALSYVNWNKPTIDDTKDSSDKKKKLLQHIGDASGVNLNKYIYGMEQPQEKKSRGQLVFDTLFAIATGGLSLTEKLGANWVKNQLESNFTKQQKTKKLIDSLPINHPERIELLSKMKIKTPDDDGHGGDGTNIKIEEIETVNKTKAQMAKDEEYLKMQKVAYLHYLEQQKTRQAYLDNFRQMFLANKGGLAGLFRVKNT